jgi:hypothetical protein
MLCCVSVMLCYVMLCYVMLCYVMLCYVMLCYVMLCYVMLCYVMLCYVMLCYVMLCYVMLCYVMLCYVMSCHAMPCYVMLCYVNVMLCYVVFWEEDLHSKQYVRCLSMYWFIYVLLAFRQFGRLQRRDMLRPTVRPFQWPSLRSGFCYQSPPVDWLNQWLAG